jgi:subtilase family serine protease
MRPVMERLDDLVLLSTLTPAQVSHAYGADSFSFVQNGQSIKADGTGQTIAIVDAYHDANLYGDLQAFDRNFGLPDPAFSQYSYTTQSDDGWAVESALDVEWAHAMAPGADIMIVEARSSSFADLMTAVNFARQQPGVVAVSMSFGGGEFSGQTNYDSTFTTPAGHGGVTFLAATGDNGAAAGASYPSSSPNVVAVGGTSLRVDSAGNYLGESAWSGGGGGYSRVEREPAYQRSVQATGVRTVPDVAMDADPNTGLYVYATTPSTGQAGWYSVGGTSASTPMFAGLIAVADQGRAIQGKTSLDGATQTLPAIYSSTFTADFRDVTTGSNGYAAKAGYDLATGRGTPMAFGLVRDLMGLGLLVPETGHRSADLVGGSSGARR